MTTIMLNKVSGVPLFFHFDMSEGKISIQFLNREEHEVAIAQVVDVEKEMTILFFLLDELEIPNGNTIPKQVIYKVKLTKEAREEVLKIEDDLQHFIVFPD